MAYKKAKSSAAIKTSAGVTHTLTGKAVGLVPYQEISDFDETMIGSDFPYIKPIVIGGGVEMEGALWEAGNPILAEFSADREVEVADWSTESGLWHWGKYVLPEASPQDFNGIYSFNGTWPLNVAAVAGTMLSTAKTGISNQSVKAGSYAFIYTSVATDASVTVTKSSASYTVELSGGKGFICAQLKTSTDAIIPSDLSDAAITVSAGADVVWGFGQELFI